jgi:anti-sigma factor RsiW
MNPISEEILQAYVDRELGATEVAQIDAALAHDELLARRVQQLRAIRAQLKSLFDPVLDEPVPEQLSALLRPAPPAVSVSTVPPTTQTGHRGFGAGRRRTSRRWLVPGAAVAASLAVLAVAFWWPAGSSLVRMQDGQQFAAGALSRTLDQGLASAPDRSAAVTIGLTFRSADGHICRTFARRASPAMAGLACHEAAGWSLPVLSTEAESKGGELRQAASDLPPAVQAAVDSRIRGDAFDAQQERAARDGGWR